MPSASVYRVRASFLSLLSWKLEEIWKPRIMYAPPLTTRWLPTMHCKQQIKLSINQASRKSTILSINEYFCKSYLIIFVRFKITAIQSVRTVEAFNILKLAGTPKKKLQVDNLLSWAELISSSIFFDQPLLPFVLPGFLWSVNIFPDMTVLFGRRYYQSGPDWHQILFSVRTRTGGKFYFQCELKWILMADYVVAWSVQQWLIVVNITLAILLQTFNEWPILPVALMLHNRDIRNCSKKFAISRSAKNDKCDWRRSGIFFFFFSNNAHILLRVMSCMAEVHEVPGTTVELLTDLPIDRLGRWSAVILDEIGVLSVCHCICTSAFGSLQSTVKLQFTKMSVTKK